MAAIAKKQGYGQTKLLLTKDAKSSAVIGAITELSRILASGDILLLTYSGHGGQVPDEKGEEDDGWDETWCVYDRQLLDDELYQLFGLFEPGARIFMLSDSCHSGTVARMRREAKLPELTHVSREAARSAGGAVAAEIRPDTFSRLAPIEVTLANYRANLGTYRAIKSGVAAAEKTRPKAQVILISGCMDGQTSLDGTHNGLFTGTLKRVWDNGAFKGGYRRLARAFFYAGDRALLVRYAEALQLYERVLRIYQKHGQELSVGQTLARPSRFVGCSSAGGSPAPGHGRSHERHFRGEQSPSRRLGTMPETIVLWKLR
jgi:metacaspase-1